MNLLEEILDHKRTEIARLDIQALRNAAEHSPSPRDFRSAIASRAIGNIPRGSSHPRLIAELKRASPSKGVLAPDIDLFEVADTYAGNGASAISVLTDLSYFRGELQTLYDLRFVRNSTLPLLRKDFIIAESQLYESRAFGADAILLIAAAITDDSRFSDLHALALELGLTPLVEVHDEFDVERTLRLHDVRLIGINNRDLTTFKVSIANTEHLRPLIPAGIAVVAESGIFTVADVERLAKADIDAVLVGEALITAADIAEKVRELSGLNVREV